MALVRRRRRRLSTASCMQYACYVIRLIRVRIHPAEMLLLFCTRQFCLLQFIENKFEKGTRTHPHVFRSVSCRSILRCIRTRTWAAQSHAIINKRHWRPTTKMAIINFISVSLLPSCMSRRWRRLQSRLPLGRLLCVSECLWKIRCRILFSFFFSNTHTQTETETDIFGLILDVRVGKKRRNLNDFNSHTLTHSNAVHVFRIYPV